MLSSERAALWRAILTRQSPKASRDERVESLATLMSLATQSADEHVQDSAINFLVNVEKINVIADRPRTPNVDGICAC